MRVPGFNNLPESCQKSTREGQGVALARIAEAIETNPLLPIDIPKKLLEKHDPRFDDEFGRLALALFADFIRRPYTMGYRQGSPLFGHYMAASFARLGTETYLRGKVEVADEDTADLGNVLHSSFSTLKRFSPYSRQEATILEEMFGMLGVKNQPAEPKPFFVGTEPRDACQAILPSPTLWQAATKRLAAAQLPHGRYNYCPAGRLQELVWRDTVNAVIARPDVIRGCITSLEATKV